jgi:diguanylate cyclase (GGDEF)-like protein
LFRAVNEGIRWVLGERPAAAPRPLAGDALRPIQVGVSECLAALDRLQVAIAHEIDQRHRLEADLAALRTELTQAQAELVGTQASEQQARRLALHDGLTSLPNRDFFRSRLDGTLARADPQNDALAVFYLDLDGFKAVNDTHGHGVGDALLKIVAERLARAVRTEDIVSRLSGDEFACLLPGLADRNHVARVARKVVRSVADPVKIGRAELSVRPSIGIAIYPRDGLTSEVLLGRADTAMYRAKRRQSGFAFFGESRAYHQAAPSVESAS